MWKLRPQHTIAIQILVTTRLTYALVLLTANLEDVKKIARQFVDDSVADQIAHFLVQAGVTKATNISEENIQNENINEISDDEWNIYHQSPQSSSGEDREASERKDAVNRVKTNKYRTDTTPVTKPKVFPFKKFDKDIERDLNLNALNTVKRTTSYYTYDLILTQDYKQTPKFEWKKEVSFDFVPNQNFAIPKTYFYDTLESPIKKDNFDKHIKELDNYYPKKLFDTTLKPIKQYESPKGNVRLIKKKKTKTTDVDKALRIDELKREIEEKFESRFNEIGTTLKPIKTFKRPKPNLEFFQHSPTKKIAGDKILETNYLKHESKERTGSTRLRDRSGVDVTNKYAKDRFDFKDSIYVKKEIVATSGPVQLYKSTPAPSRLRHKDPLEDLLGRSGNENINVPEHKNYDDSLYFKSHLEKLFRRQDDDVKPKANITKTIYNTNSSIYTNRLDDETDESRILSMEDTFKTNQLAEENDDVIKILSKKDKYRKNKLDRIKDELSSSKEDNEYRRMKLEETTAKDYIKNPDYKSSESYGDYL